MNIKKAKHALRQFFASIKTKNIVPIQQITDQNGILNNRVALITGGSGGIGKAIAKSFLDSKCKVIIAGTNQSKLESCVNELAEFGEVKYCIINLKDINNLINQMDEAIKLFGRIDILVNSAGVHSTKEMTSFLNTTPDEYDNIMNINLKGTYFASQWISKYWISEQIHGHILNISSSTGGEPAWSAYRLSKLGIEGLTKGLAQVLSPYGIVVNGIAPGSTATALLDYKKGDTIATTDNAVGRYVLPIEVASYAKMLVSDLGNMICGDTLYISGGRGVWDIR